MIVSSWLSAQAVREEVGHSTHPLQDIAWLMVVGPFAALWCLGLVGFAAVMDLVAERL